MYMNNIDWNLLKSFSYVVSEGSLSGAARALGTTQPTIGRHIEALEEQLGLPLFVRSREGLTPTEEALNLLPETEAMVASYGALLRRVTGDKPEEMGTVRISASEIMGVEVLPAMLKKFHTRAPGIHVELSISNRLDNLLKRDADVAVRMSDPIQEALIAKKIGVSPVGLFAHKTYLNKAGYPSHIGDLKDHIIIGPDTDILFLQALKTFGLNLSRENLSFRVDNQIVQLELLRKGVGIGAMQKRLATREKGIVNVLEDEISVPMPVWLVMHENLRSSRRIRLLYEFLLAELSKFLDA